MKTKSILLSLAIFAGTLAAGAQDSSKIQLTFPAQYHAFIVAFMPSKSEPSDIRYLNQVAEQISYNAQGKMIDSMQQITVVVSGDQIKKMYLAIGSAQERLAAFYNTKIKDLLVPQLMAARPAVLMEIIALKEQNGNDTEQLVQLGFDYLKAIR